MSFDDELTTAEQNRPTKDVTVCLDGELAREREELLAALEAAEAKDNLDLRLAGPNDVNAAPVRERLEALAEAAKGALKTLRFTRLEGDKWAELTSRHPVRIDVPMDRHYGYNYDAVCGAAAMLSGVLVEGDEVVSLSAEQWARLLKVLSGNEVGLIRDAVFTLNEYEPSKRLDALVKGFGAASGSVTQ